MWVMLHICFKIAIWLIVIKAWTINKSSPFKICFMAHKLWMPRGKEKKPTKQAKKEHGFSGFVIAAFALDGFPSLCSPGMEKEKENSPHHWSLQCSFLALTSRDSFFFFQFIFVIISWEGLHGKGQFNFLCETSLFEGKRMMLLCFSQSTTAL